MLKKGWISWLLLENLELAILMLVTAVVVGMDLVGAAFVADISLEVRLSIVMALLAMLAFHILREGYIAEKQRARDKRDSELLSKLLKLAESGAAGVECVDPRTQVDIWEDFEGSFYGWNPLFCLEKHGSRDNWLEIHSARYLSPKITEVQYLFLCDDRKKTSGDEERYSSYQSFVEKLAQVSKKVKGEISNKLKTYVVKGQSSLVFFIGVKHGMDFCILYVDEPPFTKGGVPQWAFIFRDPLLIKTLRGKFDEVRKNHKPLSLDDVLDKERWESEIVQVTYRT
jgi:hypothetical protein